MQRSGTGSSASPRLRDRRFFVRIWHEGARGETRLRGFVEQVGTAQRLYFTSLADISDFIRLRLGTEEEEE